MGFHPGTEHCTILRGGLQLSVGPSSMEKPQLQSAPPSFFTHPPSNFLRRRGVLNVPPDNIWGRKKSFLEVVTPQ
jgi:hypothetical protein